VVYKAHVTDVDPWFAAVADTFASVDFTDRGPNPDLIGRLQAAAAGGDYTAPDTKVSDTAAAGPHGPVPVRVYEPLVSGPDRPMLVWNHGGAFLAGDLDMPEADATAREICTRAGAVVVSVDYRLCQNGVHYPVPHDDVVAAYRWSVQRAPDFGVAPQRISLGGASAGANLAAGACLRLRDDGDAVPRALLLLYPALHAVLPAPAREAQEAIAQLPPLLAFAPELWRVLIENYVGCRVAAADSYALPAAAQLGGLPPTLIVNCEYDGLRASGEAFASALADAGVVVEQLLAHDVLHGHINAPWLPQAQQSYADMARWVRGQD
jgi:acetyl esterase/lipase